MSCLVPSYVKSKFLETTGKAHDIKNVYDKLKEDKTYNSGRPEPELWEANGIDPMIVADTASTLGLLNSC